MVTQSLYEELGALIAAILHEDRDFHFRSGQMRIDQRSIDEMHTKFKDNENLGPNHDRVRSAHEAMFKVHRKIATDHGAVLAYCRRIAEKLKAGHFNEREIAGEIEHLKGIFADMQEEHHRMETERKKILAEHNAIVRSLGCCDEENGCL